MRPDQYSLSWDGAAVIAGQRPCEHRHRLPADVVVPTMEDYLRSLRDAEADCVWKQFSEIFPGLVPQHIIREPWQ